MAKKKTENQDIEAPHAGRPSLFTKERADFIVQKINAGLPEGTAGVLAGIDETTVSYWKSRGFKEGKGKYFDFFIAVREASAKAQAGFFKVVADDAAIARNAKSAQWILEHRWAKDFPKHLVATTKLPDGSNVPFTVQITKQDANL